jgi:adenine-specific DNA glycosylase
MSRREVDRRDKDLHTNARGGTTQTTSKNSQYAESSTRAKQLGGYGNQTLDTSSYLASDIATNTHGPKELRRRDSSASKTSPTKGYVTDTNNVPNSSRRVKDRRNDQILKEDEYEDEESLSNTSKIQPIRSKHRDTAQNTHGQKPSHSQSKEDQFWISADGINRIILQNKIQKFLGPEAYSVPFTLNVSLTRIDSICSILQSF